MVGEGCFTLVWQVGQELLGFVVMLSMADQHHVCCKQLNKCCCWNKRWAWTLVRLGVLDSSVGLILLQLEEGTIFRDICLDASKISTLEKVSVTVVTVLMAHYFLSERLVFKSIIAVGEMLDDGFVFRKCSINSLKIFWGSLGVWETAMQWEQIFLGRNCLHLHVIWHIWSIWQNRKPFYFRFHKQTFCFVPQAL